MSLSQPSPQLLRGIQLNQLGRHADAERALREALAQEPSDGFALHQLAISQFHQPSKQEESLRTVGEALRLEPNDAEHHILKSFILSSLDRPKPALESARAALSLDPNNSNAFASECQAYLQMEEWAKAEESAREALALDADNSLAANQLAQALRVQKKSAENARHLTGMLARDPEDAFTHANAGWAALQNGNQRQAEEHFREALRLDPEMDYARSGLMESFRARSRFYRAYQRYCFAMQALNKQSRWMVIIGLYLGNRFARTLTNTSLKPFAYAFCGLYMVFVLWVWVATGVGNLFLLSDRFARHVLYRNEKIEALLVGGGVLLGIPLLIAGLLWDLDPLIVLGAGLTAAAFPLSMTLTNGSKAGRWLFGTIGFGVLALILFLTVDTMAGFLPPKQAASIFSGGLFVCLLCTWIALIPALRKPMNAP